MYFLIAINKVWGKKTKAVVWAIQQRLYTQF